MTPGELDDVRKYAYVMGFMAGRSRDDRVDVADKAAMATELSAAVASFERWRRRWLETGGGS